MNTPYPADQRIAPQIYELANTHGVGIPLRRPKRLSTQIIFILIVLFTILCFGWIFYQIYGYIVFVILSQQYPNVNTVPIDQLANYLWFQSLHDEFWPDMVQAMSPLVGALSALLAYYPAYKTKLYICTDGLLKIFRRKDEAIRWDKVKEFYTTNGRVTSLVRLDESRLELPVMLISGRDTTILDEVKRYLLPSMLARYEHGETVTFGSLTVNQRGISRSHSDIIYWEQIGDITLERNNISIYYSEPKPAHIEENRLSALPKGKWHTWRQNSAAGGPWPNLPIFIALVDTILAQRNANYIAESATAPATPQLRTVKEIAALAKRRDKRRLRLTIASIIMAFLSILSLIVGVFIYQSVHEQQAVTRDTQLLSNYFRKIAHQPYSTLVPGEHCAHGKDFWLDDDPTNIYACQKDGLQMTEKNFQYEDDEYFTFVPDTVSTNDSFSSGHYFPHHYRIQVTATLLSGESSSCVSIEVHIQDFQGRQTFDICNNASWSYTRCDLSCDNDTQVASGNILHIGNTYLIDVDVTDSVLTLSIDNTKVTSIQDNTYTFTDQLALGLFGDPKAGGPITAIFSDFRYTPYP